MAPTPFVIGSYTVPQGDTYSTYEDGPTNTLAIVGSSNGYIRTVSHDTIGCRLRDISFLRGNQLRVTLTRLVGAALTDGLVGNWVMTLVVYPVPKGQR